MKTAWIILIVSALTDFIIAFAAGMTGGMMAGEMVEIPNKAVWLTSTLGGLMAFGRTIQQALKSGMAGNMPSPTAQEPPLPAPPPPPGIPAVVTLPPPPQPIPTEPKKE